MPKTKITQELCNNLRKGTRTKREVFSDCNLLGFCVRATPQNKIVFYAVGRLAGSDKRIDRKIGVFGKLTAAEARKKAKKFLYQMETGVDPYASRKDEAKKRSLQYVAEQFLSNYVQTIAIKHRTAVEYTRHINREILPRLGEMKIADIEHKHISAIHRELSDYPYKANRVVATFSKLLSWSEREGFRKIGENPCKHVKKYKEEKRERRLSPEEAKRLNGALNSYEELNPYFVAFVKITLLTGARRDEIRTLKWAFVNFELEQLELPDSKTGQKILPLGKVAISVLKSLPRQAGNEYVFCGFKVGRPIVNVRKPWIRLLKLADIEHVTLHDLRRTYASALLEQGVHLTVISNLLGHKSSKTTERYLGVSQSNLRKASSMAEVLLN